jgi:D-glycero-alpha-D-manno-heptose-7-phosphate kinase
MPENAGVRQIINSIAPVRICDNGGWTDTWFARYGRVFNVAVSPCVEVQLVVRSRSDFANRVVIHAENFRDSYAVPHPAESYVRHPIPEACVNLIGIPDDVSIEIFLFSDVPAGCSTGTSAAVGVALIAALERLAGRRRTPREIASAAHRVETELLRQQSGIQDQIASAWGGINYIEMFRYPDAEVTQLDIPGDVLVEFESRLALVFVGQSHSSTATHEMVIRGLESSGPDAPALAPIRKAADTARDALCAGDLAAFGRSMLGCTEAQRALHPALIGPRHQAVIDVASQCGAIGWKVNGAGGDGGSVTLLSGPIRRQRREMLEAVLATNPDCRVIPIRLSPHGVRTWVHVPGVA